MKKVLIIGGSAVLLLGIIIGSFFAGPLLASAQSSLTTTGVAAAAATPTATATPAANSYCDQYQQDLAKRLGISVSTLQQDGQAAFGDVLAQMVKDGKLTQSQANAIKQRIASRPACSAFYPGHFGRAPVRHSHRRRR